MKLASIKTFLQTMHDYPTVNITQIFASEDKTQSLTVRYIGSAQVFSIFSNESNHLWEIKSVDNTALFIEESLKNSILSINS